MTKTIAIKDLTFQYSKSKKILNNLSINVPQGSIYGFLGKNGAGKSTTMGIITGLIPITETDKVKIFNQPIDELYPHAFSRIGSLIEFPSFYPHLSGFDNLKYLAKIRKSKTNIAEILSLIGLENEANKAVKNYSMGMKQRLAIGGALLGDPELLLLDEPVNGLDPSGIIEIRNLLIKLNQEKGITIFISSHLLAEIEKMCTHVGILKEGSLVFEGTMKKLIESNSQKKIELSLQNSKKWISVIQDNYGITAEYLDENSIVIKIDNSLSTSEFVKKLINEGVEIEQFKVQEDLENLFIEITNNK
ncbi:MAG: ATP-binding cassette domain-containing protein [Flavobacteriales bacterium]|jgi:ABC-2 type transport system ATP-binding protein|nr:ATP-binding cassette domain-containing protein [Flavobacteriales bacterium]